MHVSKPLREGAPENIGWTQEISSSNATTHPMNLFLIASTPVAIASDHCDKHVIKMILETAQLLYTTWWCLNPAAVTDLRDPKAYRATHRNHPVAVWVRARPEHYRFALDVAIALCSEYTRRYGKVHKTQAHIERLTLLGMPPCRGEDRSPAAHKRAVTGLPKGIEYFHCAVNDDLFNRCAVHDDAGNLDAIATYRAYYKAKPWTMNWNRGKDTQPTWY